MPPPPPTLEPAPSEPLTRDQVEILDIGGKRGFFSGGLGEQNVVDREPVLLGCTADVACDGLEAIGLAKANRYDAILMDLNLPDISGVEVLRKLRLNKVLTPVVVLSGQTISSRRSSES